jgi:hypothetical protein
MFGIPVEIVAAFVSAVVAFAVAIITLAYNKEKSKADIELTKAEIEKSKIEIEKSKAEIDNLKAQTRKLDFDAASLTKVVQSVSARIFSGESKIYDASTGMTGFDFRGSGDYIFGTDKSGSKGEGDCKIEDNLLKIHRINKDGSFRVLLQKYIIENTEYDYLPKNPSTTGKRKLLVRCEAKAVGASHELTFCLKTKDGSYMKRTAPEKLSDDWKSVERYFQVDPFEDIRLWIEDSEVTGDGTSLYVRNLLLVEVLNQANVASPEIKPA